MAENDDSKGSKNVIKVEEEIEGDQIGTQNYRFSKIGESVPIRSDADFKFEMDSLPSRPLAVSERFGVIFVAHSSGFCVARTKDVIDMAEELKNGGNGYSIQELSVVDVSLGKVSILALSAGSSMLAASVGLNLYFFSVAGLLNKDLEPSFSKSFNGSSCIKDMQWSTQLEDHYVVLTTDGNLYHGAGQGDLNNLMDNIDAVNWSMNGKFLAVAKYNYLTILSSKFKEKLRIILSFDSLVDYSDADCVVKVDSVRWVRPDCIILGCYSQRADGKEENYVVQLITVKEGKISNPSSNPVALSFSDAFLAINEDDIPPGSGPHMFVSYLDERELAFVANRKNTDQHIVLFGWSSDKNNGAAMIEISNDAWLPTINLQDNSDDNLILGLAVSKAYHDEKIRLVLGEEDTEVSPCCVLLCLTVDGKLFMFHFASATGPSVLPEGVSSLSDEEEESPSVSSQSGLLNICNDEKQIGDQALNELQPQKVKGNEPSGKAGYEADMRSGDEQVKPTPFSQLFKGGTQQDVPVIRPNDDRDEGQSLFSQKQDDNSVTPSVSSQRGLLNICNDEKQIGDQGLNELQPQNVKGNEPTPFSQLFKGGTQQDVPVIRPNDGRDEGQSLSSQKQDDNSDVALFKTSQPLNPSAMVKDLKTLENQELAGVKSSADSVSKSGNDKSNKTLFGTSLGDFRVSTESSGNIASVGLHGSSESFSSGSVFSSNVFGVQSSSSHHAGVQRSAELSGKVGSTSLHGSSGSFSSGGIFSSGTFGVKSPLSLHASVQGNRPDTSSGTTHFPSGSQKFSFDKRTSGSLASSNLLGQGSSTGSGFTNSLPVVTNAQLSLGRSSDFKFFDKGNHRSHTPSRQLTSEPNLSEQRSVEEMAKELDTLLDSIEGPGGFYDASVALHKASVTVLEEGIWALSDRCRKWTDTMDQGLGEVQLLLDKTVQVLARKIYMEAIVKQATDSQYWDIWNRQKLSSELDMKRRHILEINQNLTNQLIELERHLNTLELQRFGDKGDVQTNRRSFHTKHGPPRHIQSLHSLHNTMNAQLAAAEKLSECLSKQMARLSIDTEPVKKQNVKKELFETIGISYDGATFSPPGHDKARESSSKNNKVLVSSGSAAAKAHLNKSQPSAVKSAEPETARRRRDSLDRSWASIEPPKTTVKRMLLQEDRQMSPARLSLPTATQKLNHRFSQGSVVSQDMPRGALNLSQSKGGHDARLKRQSDRQSNSSPWDNYRSDSSSTLGTDVLSLGTDSQSKPMDSPDPTAERSRNRLTFSLKSDPLVVNDAKSSQQSQSFPEPSSNNYRSDSSSTLGTDVLSLGTDSQSKLMDSPDPTAERSRNRLTFSLKSDPLVVNDAKSSQQSQSFPEPSSNTTTNIFQKKPITFSESGSKDNVKSNSTAGDANPKRTVTESPSFWSKKSQESPVSTVLNTSSSTAFSGKSFSLGEVASSSSITSFPVPVTLSTSPSFVFKDTNSSATKLGATQTVQPSVSSASFPSFPSSISFAPKEPTTSSSITPSTNIESNISNSEPSKLTPNMSESSTPQVVSVPKFDSKPNESSSAQSQTSPSQPTLGLSVPSVPTTEPPTSSYSSSATNSPALVSNSKPEQPSLAPALSSPAVPNPADVALAQEDEMEEEAPDTTLPTLGNFGGFGFGLGSGSSPNPAPSKQNPFGASFGNLAANTQVTSFTAPAPGGGLFRPASFNIESSQPSQPSQQTNFGAFSGGFGGNNNQSNAGQGFGQPAQIGSGQQALGSVLGSFGQSRQLGAGLPGSVAASQSPFGGGFGGNQSAGGGFAAAVTGGGGFANMASGGGGFGALAAGGGGFVAAATGGSGFAAAATGGGGFAAAPPAAGGGFAGAASGGFGGFSSQGGSGFSTFGSTTGATGRPPSQLFTQMRK